MATKILRNGQNAKIICLFFCLAPQNTAANIITRNTTMTRKRKKKTEENRKSNTLKVEKPDSCLRDMSGTRIMNMSCTTLLMQKKSVNTAQTE